ncbi:MAG: Fumarylacetoacetate hydrolase family, partial [Gaiellaceae bacterium]|nr:Fumarylacetoacetate hydrolase family [Gaiellaceae bacterium]
YTLMNAWDAPELAGTKAVDFAISLGPIVVTPDELPVAEVDFDALVAHAGANTHLRPGDVITAPGGSRKEMLSPGDTAEIGLPPFGTLRNRIAQLGSATS